MRTRCCNAKHPTYKRYGGRGINIYPEWINNFDQFKADMGSRPAGMTLDRIDNNGNYTPTNCRWASITTQSGNRRTNLVVEWKGQKCILTDVARLENVCYVLLRHRWRKGATLDAAVASLKDDGHLYKERAASRRLV